MQLNRLSTTPPLPLLVSKRDKKRLAALERLNDISASFALNRDAHYRTQLQSLQLDMNYINHADPYQNKPLEDTADEICAEITSSLIGNAHGGIRSGARATDFEAPPGLGKWSAIFPQEVNNAMEERDTQLTELAVWLFFFPHLFTYNLTFAGGVKNYEELALIIRAFRTATTRKLNHYMKRATSV